MDLSSPFNKLACTRAKNCGFISDLLSNIAGFPRVLSQKSAFLADFRTSKTQILVILVESFTAPALYCSHFAH